MYVINSQGSMIFNHPPEGMTNISVPYNLNGYTALEFMRGYVGDAIFLLEGGADISPSIYGMDKEPYTHSNAARDYEEIIFYNAARELGIPVLGICRGHQLMTALEGGTLYQDLDIEAFGRHVSEHRINHTVHSMESGFYELMKSCPLGSPNVVNSYHHQGTKLVPSGAKVLATAPDGIVEALLYDNGLSVQWHPEFLGHSEFLTWMRDTFLKVA